MYRHSTVLGIFTPWTLAPPVPHTHKHTNTPTQTQPVEVLWIFNHQWAAWEASLPKDTRDRLMRERSGPDGKGKGVHHVGVVDRQLLDGELLQGPKGVSGMSEMIGVLWCVFVVCRY